MLIVKFLADWDRLPIAAKAVGLCDLQAGGVFFGLPSFFSGLKKKPQNRKTGNGGGWLR
jgi:hypothetical protein